MGEASGTTFAFAGSASPPARGSTSTITSVASSKSDAMAAI